MRYFIIFISLSLALLACQKSGNENGEMPEDLEGKRSLLQEKQQALRELTKEIDELEEAILTQDPQAAARAGKLVTTMQVKLDTFQRYMEIQGSVEAEDVVTASPEVSGRIIQLNVKEGDAVIKGQLIAQLDVEQVEKQIAELETSLELAKTIYERQSRLWEQNIGSEIQYLEAKNNKERLEKSLETIQVQVSKSKVYSPITGVVDMVLIKQGELAVPGAPIVQILSTNRLKVVADLPEVYLRSVSRGDQVGLHFPSLDLDQVGRVSRLGSTIDKANRTFEVEVNVSNTQGLLKPNLLAVMEVLESEQKNVLMVPVDILQQEVGGRKFVFAVEEGEEGPIVKKQFVRTGEDHDGWIIITDGLELGDQLVVEGANGLVDGQVIRINNTKTTAING